MEFGLSVDGGGGNTRKQKGLIWRSDVTEFNRSNSQLAVLEHS